MHIICVPSEDPSFSPYRQLSHCTLILSLVSAPEDCFPFYFHECVEEGKSPVVIPLSKWHLPHQDRWPVLFSLSYIAHSLYICSSFLLTRISWPTAVWSWNHWSYKLLFFLSSYLINSKVVSNRIMISKSNLKMNCASRLWNFSCCCNNLLDLWKVELLNDPATGEQMGNKEILKICQSQMEEEICNNHF